MSGGRSLTAEQNRARQRRHDRFFEFRHAAPEARLDARDRLVAEITAQRLRGLVSASELRAWLTTIGVYRD